ncbi:hypothetical protein HMI54_007245 [Coelomomyces lativittatus]|nr:hypothetical protein HMI54_007245 [Coelomomyces lativittatus]
MKTYFENALDRLPYDLATSIRTLRTSLKLYTDALMKSMQMILKSSSGLRECLIHFFSHALQLNEKRNAMQIDHDQISSFGFVQNCVFVLLGFCDPFLLPVQKKVHLIDPYYLASPQARVQVTGITKLNASEEESKLYYESLPISEKSPNFISDCFYLTAAWMHTGFIRSLIFYTSFSKEFSEKQNHFNQLQEDKHKWENTPQQTFVETMMARLKVQLNADMAFKLSMEAYFLDPEFLDQAFRFFNLTAVWFLRLICKTHEQLENFEFPLVEENQVVKHLPEYFIEDMLDFLLFILRFERLFVNQPFDHVLELFLVLLMNPHFLKNPYLKSKIIEVLFFMTFNTNLMYLVSSHALSVKYLVTSIMQFYVDVEVTGMSSQFYDKFNIRYNISQILKSVWSFPVHRNRVKELSRQSCFIRFVNMMMNDTRYLLDEGLTKLSEICTLQTEMDSPQWTQLSNQERNEKLTTLNMAERQATSYMSLASQTLDTFNYISKDIPAPFLTPEIIDRLAAMLNYNLQAMVGPKCTELKVKSPDKYRFFPKKLLSDLVDIYLNLSGFSEFIHAVARDGRSYKRVWFQKAAGALLKTGQKSQSDIDLLSQFVEAVEAALLEESKEEEELGEIPDEFLDPIMFSLMEDPVILPTSGTTLDRSTITAHLLGEKRDPFNRKELKIEEVIPNTELKEKIMEFKKKAKSR